MIRINLLPHREEKKQVHKRQFKLMAVFAAIVTLALAALSYLVVDSMIEAQRARNEHLKTGISDLEKQITEIESLKREKEELLNRKRLVENLQKSRSDAVKIFDQLIKFTPDGIYLSKFSQNGNKVTLNGYGLSMARVSEYMSKLGQSEVFHNAEVIETQMENVDGKSVTSFILTVEVKPLDNSSDAEGATDTESNG